MYKMINNEFPFNLTENSYAMRQATISIFLTICFKIFRSRAIGIWLNTKF